MMVKGCVGILISLIGIINMLTGQQGEIVSLEEVIQTTIEQNYGIQIAEKNRAMAANNASRIAVGYNPTVNATAGSNFQVGGSKQQFSNGNENIVTSAASYGGNAGVSANYMIYDQTRSISLDQLRENLNFVDLQLRQIIETNVLQVASLYYDIAKLSANVSALEEAMEVSNKRLERVTYQYDYGQGVALDVLNAKVDVQRDSINYFNTLQLLENSMRNINVLMGMDIDRSFMIDTSIKYRDFSFQDLQSQALADNVNLLLVKKDYDVTAFDLQLIDAEKRPTLSATGAYNFSFNDSPPGAFITFSNSRGLNLGLNAAVPIYDGGLRKLRTQNTQIALQTQLLQKDQVEQEVTRDLTNAWSNYQNALFVLHSEAISLSTSEKNFDRTVEQFNVGQVTSVEFRQAQLNLLNAKTSYINAKYDAKIIELGLMQISGHLLE